MVIQSCTRNTISCEWNALDLPHVWMLKISIGHFFLHYLIAFATSGPSVCLPVYYERLVLEPENQMKRILNFLGVEWDDIVIHHEQAIGVKGGISLSR